MDKGILIALIVLLCSTCFIIVPAAQAAPADVGRMTRATGVPVPLPQIEVGFTTAEEPEEVSLGLQIIFLLTVLAIAPSLLLMVTSFTRILIILSFVQRALATQQLPPRQVIVGLSLFLTFFVMAPTFQAINTEGLQPYLEKDIAQRDAFAVAVKHMRIFMFRHTRETDVALFVNLGELTRPATKEDVPTYVLVPAFMISELKSAFTIGILLFIPFMVIDMVVASVLMSMGMIMLPPVMISLPFKILMFVMVDGWNLIAGQIVASYHLGG